jgi:hypothetical protein
MRLTGILTQRPARSPEHRPASRVAREIQRRLSPTLPDGVVAASCLKCVWEAFVPDGP